MFANLFDGPHIILIAGFFIVPLIILVVLILVVVRVVRGPRGVASAPANSRTPGSSPDGMAATTAIQEHQRQNDLLQQQLQEQQRQNEQLQQQINLTNLNNLNNPPGGM